MKMIDIKATCEKVKKRLDLYPLMTKDDCEMVHEAIAQVKGSFNQQCIKTYINPERINAEDFYQYAISSATYYRKRDKAFIEWAKYYNDGELLVLEQ